MESEIIREIVVNDQNEVLLKVHGKGKAMYQHVYREAAGVHWDETSKAFKSTDMKEWTISKWFAHIITIVKSGLNLELKMDENVNWVNIPDEERIQILKLYIKTEDL
jgi:hypothetical protein